MSLYKGRSPYHVVSQNVLGGWLGKYIYIYQDVLCDEVLAKKIPFQKKNMKNKKIQRTHLCFPFHHCLCNQSTEKDSHFTLL